MKKPIFYVLMILLAITFTFEDEIINLAGSFSTPIIPEESGMMVVTFCPDQECETTLLAEMNKATSSLQCAFFDLNLEKVIILLDKKHADGIDVKIIVDNNNKEDLEKKSYISFDTSGQYSHNKFCIIDKKITITGSMNPTSNGAFKNDNNLLVIDSPSLAKNYANEFYELWEGNFGKGQVVQYPKILFNNYSLNNYFCPEDHCKDRIVDELNKAEKSIYFMTFSFTHPDISGAIQNHPNLDVKGVFERRQNSRYNKMQDLNKTFGTMRWDSNKASMHHKVFIIDKKTVITGSMNPSKNGDTNNDENILIIRDPIIVSRFVTEFERVYGS